MVLFCFVFVFFYSLGSYAFFIVSYEGFFAVFVLFLHALVHSEYQIKCFHSLNHSKNIYKMPNVVLRSWR